MTKQEFLEYCSSTFGTSADYPFDEDFETAVLRHTDNRKWYAIAMRVSRRRFLEDCDEVIDVVNLKIPLELYGAFDAFGGVFPAYHMNTRHWISVLLPDVSDDLLYHLVNLSYDATKSKKKKAKLKEGAE
jgi:predicted DNA-binding protein (MmcQ/YjbR family)